MENGTNGCDEVAVRDDDALWRARRSARVHNACDFVGFARRFNSLALTKFAKLVDAEKCQPLSLRLEIIKHFR